MEPVNSSMVASTEAASSSLPSATMSNLPLAIATKCCTAVKSTRLALLSYRSCSMYWIFLGLLFGFQLHGLSAGSCREAQLCCTGRDSSCVVQKAPINAIIEDLSDKPCYCDHACLKLGDCCVDFKDHCGVLDCTVSDWGPWSECDMICGKGMMTRSRTVLQAAQNGGKHCPSLVQKRECEGIRCHGHHDKKLLHEKALLLPASLSIRKHEKPSNPSFGRNENKSRHDQEYCVEFEVLRSSKACRKLPPYNLLSEGDRIVVRCDLEAFIEDSFFSMPQPNPKVANTLSKLNQNSKDRAATSSKSSLNGNNENDPDEDEENSDENFLDAGSDETDDYTLLESSTTTSSTTTTSKPSLGFYHCRGEGITGRATHWTALPAPSCHGKWLRLTVGPPKHCTHAQFMFV